MFGATIFTEAKVLYWVYISLPCIGHKAADKYTTLNTLNELTDSPLRHITPIHNMFEANLCWMLIGN